MRFKGPELIVDAAVAKLKANLPDRIATINSEATDGLVVDTPDDGRYFTSAKRLYPPGTCLVVFDGRTGRAAGRSEGAHQLMTDTLLGVYVITDDADEEHLDRKLKRLNAAAIEALLDGTPKEQLQAADGSLVAWQIQYRESTPSPLFHPDGDGAPLRASRLTVFSVARLEQ